MSQKGTRMVVIVAVAGLLALLIPDLIFRVIVDIRSYEEFIQVMRIVRPIGFVLSIAFPIVLMLHFKNSVYYMVAGSAMIVLMFIGMMDMLLFSYPMNGATTTLVTLLSLIVYMLLALVFFFEKKFYIMGTMYGLVFTVILIQSNIFRAILESIISMIGGIEFYRFYPQFMVYTSLLTYVIYILQVVIIYTIIKEDESNEVLQAKVIQGIVEQHE